MTLAPGVDLGVPWVVVVVASAYARAERIAVTNKVLSCMMESRRK